MRAIFRLPAIASGLLLLVGSAHAQEAGPGEALVTRDGQFIVYSDASLAKEKATKLIDRMKEAWSFVKKEQHWQDETVLDHDLALHVLSDEKMKERAKRANGIASGPHTFLMATSFLEKERSERTIAHELTHLQDRRHLPKGTKLPHYLLEGRAIAMGRAFGEKQKVDSKEYDDRLARRIAQVSAAEAKKMLGELAYVAEKKLDRIAPMEAIGFFFLEFVRARPGGTPREGLQPKLAHLVETVGKGSTLEDAWKAEFDETLEAAQGAFFALLEKTEGKAAERLKGTVLEKASLEPPAKESPPGDAPETPKPR